MELVTDCSITSLTGSLDHYVADTLGLHKYLSLYLEYVIDDFDYSFIIRFCDHLPFHFFFEKQQENNSIQNSCKAGKMGHLHIARRIGNPITKIQFEFRIPTT